MRLMLLLAVLGIIALVAYSVWVTMSRDMWKRKVKGLDDPVLWLPRSERQEHARKLLAREQEQYDMQRQEQINDSLNDYMKGLNYR
ncbi:Uncharacterised protein [Mycobacteroides abscessus subsp. massiliense]|uniref:hypothetical protein n=1 Tax=Mycobacteroides abscessus TaxID=36809 RepID=UPI00092612F1|nr:hypothetical protein [Mycobacteroides abscessus]SHW53742.1 Uncharacterised protein [Mycobacteroides abscessus subsp. abscessus]SHX44880.1 Uncharacterised protein [Mycobacteroides abscessus subsp. abscessus]SIA40389.1 Uncharacterised protein [Mycobacteroides abscessus subsp. abscessus]SKM65931.1 Uncharacterised protein [Mycobacteroides abscessus subsp. massiliense]SKN32641.1 Uncharacterised protein [Mycobacteroides abscessus subsp. massiliense]